MDHTKCRITVFDRIYDNTHCKKIINLVQRLVLIYHLFVDTEEMFDAPVNLRPDPRLLNMRPHFCNNPIHKFLALRFPQGNLLYQIIVNFRFQIFQ